MKPFAAPHTAHALACAALAFSVPAMAEPRDADAATAQPALAYKVQAGDTLFSIAQTYMVGERPVDVLCRLNHLASARPLRVGQVLLIPRDLLRDEGTYAIIANFAGQVSFISGGQRLAARIGAAIGEGAEIETGRNAFITLRLADGTTMSLPSQTHLRLARLRRVLLTGSVERNIDLQGGRMRSNVTPMHDPNSSFRVTTPLTVSAVRGTRFSVAYNDSSASAATSVEAGEVTVDRTSSAIAAAALSPRIRVLPGFGAASTAHTESGVVSLLAPPRLAEPGKVQTGEDLHFGLRPIAGAAAYHVQVARDVSAMDVIAETSAATPEVTLPSLPLGNYFLRIAALDNEGIEGQADTYDFERRRNGISASMSQNGSRHDRHYLFQWHAVSDGTPSYRFRLVRQTEKPSAQGSSVHEVSVADEAGLTGTALTVTHLPPGTYAWQVASTLFAGDHAIETWTPPQSFHILAGRQARGT